VVSWVRGVRLVLHNDSNDILGHPKADLSISASGSGRNSAKTYIDRLYIEAGEYAVAGMSFRPNQKEKPVSSGGPNTYFETLGWVKNEFVVFYDVEDRRAWLVDGASALLHLVRISLRLDGTEPDSTYHWEFEESAVKDEDWVSSSGRAAAIGTLKNFDNLEQKVYIRERAPDTKYYTFGD